MTLTDNKSSNGVPVFYFLAALLPFTFGFYVAESPRMLQIVSRENWQAHPPVETPEPMTNPVPYVIIHHSYQPPACNTSEDCVEAMQWMQDLHQNSNGWNDIGYSFAVGGDFRAYEGRGWSSVGAHAPLYNAKSIGICVIGDWRVELPPEEQLQVVKQLIQCGVANGMIQENYTLYGHKQVREGTECPGDRLLKEISTWPNFSEDVPVRSALPVQSKKKP